MARAVITLILVAAMAAVLPAAAAARPLAPQSRWIVQLAPGASVSDVASSARRQLGVPTGQRFSTVLDGFATTMTQAQRDALAADPRVEAIVPDRPIAAAGDPYPETETEIQPGLTRVGALDNVDRPDAALDVDIAVLDTGLQADNAELNVAGGYNCTDSTQSEEQRADPVSWRDSASFGHGTHVSGIAAAIENGRGVAGVAQGARIWMVKVLTGGGSGYWSWLICGLDHVAAMREPGNPSVPRIEVVNMSIAGRGADDGDCGRSNADLLHQAICRLSDAGVTMVAAAGNERSDAANFIPGAYDEVITVSAMADWNGLADGTDAPPAPGTPPEGCTRLYDDDAFAGFSNYGADVDLIAPGTCVLSTLPFDRLGMMSGTSMATPHVAGGAALYYLAEARAGRPRPTPQQVRAALIAGGTHDWKISTDPDVNRANGVREPALAVADFDLAPGFDVGTGRQIVRASAGSRIRVGLYVARIGGFSDPVELDVDGKTLPPGASASLNNDPSVVIDLPANAAPGAWNVALVGMSGEISVRTSFRLVVYSTSAAAGGPQMSLRAGVAAGIYSLPVRVAWPAVSRARRYQLQQSVDGGPWATLGQPYGPKMDIGVAPGRRYQFRVRARVGGVWQGWSTGRSGVARAIEPSTDDVDLTGVWAPVTISGGYSELPVYSTEPSASATLAFTGRSVAWLAMKGTGRGRANVWLDGELAATVDLYASTRRPRFVVFSRSWPTAQAHSLTIEVLGDPADRPRVDLDALAVVAD